MLIGLGERLAPEISQGARNIGKTFNFPGERLA